MRMVVVTGLFALVSMLVIAMLPAGPGREAPPTPQSSSRYLRDPGASTMEIAVSAEAALADVADEEAEAAHQTVDPLTFLTPFADSVLIDHPEWICDTPAPENAIYVATDGQPDLSLIHI